MAVSIAGTGSSFIPAGQVPLGSIDYSEIQNISATDKVLGRSSSGAGVVEEITCTSTGRAVIASASNAALLSTIGAEPAANITSSARTALGIAVGSAGGVVTNGGALGTPASGVATNLTGLPAASVVPNTGGGASSGKLGEIISSVVGSGSAVTATRQIACDVTSISLTAGIWLIRGNINWVTLGTTPTGVYGWISSTSASAPDQSRYSALDGVSGFAGTTGIEVPSIIVNVGSTTTYYLSELLLNSSENGTACGSIHAVRVG